MSRFCVVDLKVGSRNYQGVRLAVLPQLCSNVVLGQDLQGMHDSITLKYEGGLPPLVICGLNTFKVNPPELFANFIACYSISAKSHQYLLKDKLLLKRKPRGC